MSIPGVDYAWSRPGGAALKAAGMRFAARYLSADLTKNITRAEANDLAAHGVNVVVVWETTQRRATAGRAAGAADARTALGQATAAGMPSGRPIYFAIDYDAPESDQSAIDAYFSGVASVLGLARTGAYGGYWPLSRLKTAGLARWFWQTAGWSGSNRLSGMHLWQPASTVTINGVSCDHDTAMTADYGQWTPDRAPVANKEDDMPTAQDVWNADVIPAARAPYANADAKQNPTWQAKYALQTGVETGRQTLALVKSLTAQVAALTAAVGALAQGGGITAEQIKAAAEAGADAALEKLGDALQDPAPAGS